MVPSAPDVVPRCHGTQATVEPVSHYFLGSMLGKREWFPWSPLGLQKLKSAGVYEAPAWARTVVGTQKMHTSELHSWVILLRLPIVTYKA